MPNRLIDVKKVGCFCDAIAHTTEKRPDGEVKVVQLTLRVQPFDAKLATAVRPDVRQTLFKLNTVEEQPHLDRVQFKLGTPRQNLYIFAAPDTTKASLLLDHAKISGVVARTEKGVNGYGLVFKATFGPASRDELAYVEDWRNGQRFVTFEEAEHSLEFDVPEEDDDEDEPADDSQKRLADEWDDHDARNPNAAATAEPVDAAEAEGDPPSDREPARRPARRHPGRKPNGKGEARAH